MRIGKMGRHIGRRVLSEPSRGARLFKVSAFPFYNAPKKEFERKDFCGACVERCALFSSQTVFAVVRTAR